MSALRQPLAGPGRVQWNAGGWFGASMGSSTWMLITAGFLVFYKQPALALVPAAGFAVVLFVAVALWARRHHVFPFTALMTLLG